MFPLTRRHFLTSSLTLAGTSAFAITSHSGARALGALPLELTLEKRSLVVKGKSVSVFGIRQPNGTPGAVIEPDQRFRVDVVNRAGEDSIIHWHGQTRPNVQDGVVETGSALIKAGAGQRYDFVPRPGTHWMHSHLGLQEQKLMAAPLIVRSAEDQRLDAQDVIVLLHDFSFAEPDELLAKVMKRMGNTSMQGMNMAGMNMSQMHRMMHGNMDMSGMNMAGMPMGDAAMDLNDVDYDAYLANDRTLDDPLIVRTERRGRVRLRLINGATSTAFWIDLGSTLATVLAVDGNPVRPITGTRFPLAQAQRLDLLIAMPDSGGAVPVLAQREGDRARTGIVLATPDAAVTRVSDHADAPAGALDLGFETQLAAASPLSNRPADITHAVTLTGSMTAYQWGIDGRSWSAHEPLMVARGQRVALAIRNQSMMAHPMHLHGHHFQVVEINERPVLGAVRDTVLVPPMSSVTVALDADNPGRWLFHCHNLLHMASGMMTEVKYTS